MNKRVCFTVEEGNELRKAMKSGGIFLKLFPNLDANVEVQGTDENDGWKTIKSLDRTISSKINTLYNEQKIYKAPLVDGYRQVSISWFIASFC